MARHHDTRERLLEAATELIWESSYGSTSVGAICERAGVNRGSFYHFFESKVALAVAALEEDWRQDSAVFEEIFAPVVPPLERFRRVCVWALEQQEKLAQTKGFVVGCPLFTLGSELCTQSEPVRQKVREILAGHRAYLVSALRDAVAAGVITPCDPAAKANILLSYYEGQLTRARIENDLQPIRDMLADTFEILGVRVPEAELHDLRNV